MSTAGRKNFLLTGGDLKQNQDQYLKADVDPGFIASSFLSELISVETSSPHC